MWATDSEIQGKFLAETFAPADYRIRDVYDNGEFLTGATLDLYLRGQLVGTETFVASSEFPNDGPAHRLATSFAEAWVESETYSLEERLGPFGLEWQREQEGSR